MQDLPHSRLYTFIDGERRFALYFLEGQRLIQELALRHALHHGGFAYLRDTVLSIQPTIALLRHGEQFGFYIDSEEPFFRLKIEAGHNGTMRSTLMPEQLEACPETVHGTVRLLKLFPRNRPPYESALHAEALPLRAIVNHVLTQSYQVNCLVLVAQSSDQSLMLHQLPPLAGKEDYEFSAQALRERRRSIEEAVEEIFARALMAPEEITVAFDEIGFRLLASREVQFHCSCSRERMIHNLHITFRGDFGQAFEPGSQTLEITCEYCKSHFEISRTDLEQSADPLH